VVGRTRSTIKVEYCCYGMRELQQFLKDNIAGIKFILLHGILEIRIAANISLCSLHFKPSVYRL
jgi:hypothetical protein